MLINKTRVHTLSIYQVNLACRLSEQEFEFSEHIVFRCEALVYIKREQSLEDHLCYQKNLINANESAVQYIWW